MLKRRRSAAEDAEPQGEGEGAGDAPVRSLRLSAKSTAVPARRAQLKSLPAKHTTSYGSPAPVLPLQGSGGYGSDLRAATRDIFAAVRRDNKKAKLQHDAALADEAGESSRMTRSRSRQSSRAPTPVTEEEEPESEAGEEPEEDVRPAPPADPPLNTSGAVETALRRVQARQAERRRKEQEDKARLDREERERAERERVEQEERERVKREERERIEQERVQKQEKERADRDRAERREMNRLAREARERAQKEEQEQAQREQQARVERERREQAGEAERLRITKTQERQPDPEEEAGRARSREEFERLVARVNKQRQDEARAASEGPGPTGPVFAPPKKRTGQEFLDELFFSPKRPRNNQQTPSAALLDAQRRNVSQPPASAAVSVRSYIEESHVFKDADVQTPAPSSVVNTPSRAPLPGHPASRGASQPPLTQVREESEAINPQREAQDVWRSGLPPPPPPTQPPLQAGPSLSPGLRQHALGSQTRPSQTRESLPQRTQPVTAPVDNDELEESQNRSSATPRRSNRQVVRRVNLATERSKDPGTDPAADEELGARDRRRQGDVNSPSDSDNPSPRRMDNAAGRRPKTHKLRLPQENGRARGGAPPGGRPPPEEDTPLRDRFRRSWKDKSLYFWRTLRLLGYCLAFLFALNFLFFLWHRIGRSDWESHGTYGPEWHGWNHMGRNIAQLIPYELRHPLGFLDDAEYSALQNHIYSQDERISKLTDQTSDVRQATQKLEGILPRVVSVKQDKKTSRLVIQQDFWHALKDLMQAEKSILTLERGKDGINNISDDHWVAVLKRLRAQGVLTFKEIDGIVQGAVSRTWDKWLKKNRVQVDKVLGSPSGTPLSPDVEKQVESLIRDKVSGPELRDIVVTREEFIREVEKSINAHRREAQAELAQVQQDLKEMIEAGIRQAAASNSGGMTRQEVVALANDLIAQAISNAALEGAAKGSINANFELDLSRRVNYFALGNGATIEKTLTSPSYRPPHADLSFGSMFGSAEWRKAKLSSPRYVQAEAAALTAWEEAGHCWCAGSKSDGPYGQQQQQPADINVRLARSIVPENVVVEHIDPAATLDPGAMPRDVEVWAFVDEYTAHGRARDFMLASWPDTPRDHPLIRKGYLKIGEFGYDYDPATRGVVVYRVSEELRSLGVSTDLVLVRAASNWGADHTCFYRVRLYGSPVDSEGEGEAARDELRKGVVVRSM